MADNMEWHGESEWRIDPKSSIGQIHYNNKFLCSTAGLYDNNTLTTLYSGQDVLNMPMMTCTRS